MIRPIERAVAQRSGPLELRPITFATDDYYFRPTKVAADEGRLRVPERHDAPGGREIEIHFVRFRATAEERGDPIVYLAGGPGGSGTLSAAGDRFRLFMKLRAAGDVIALDQRGTSYTRPHAVCPGTWSYPLDQPLSAATLQGVLRPYLDKCSAFWRDSLDLDAFTTPQSVEDLEMLRVTLGADRLNLWGISYGTHLALAYIRKYPDRVARAILAGVEGPDDTYKLPVRVDRVLMSVDSAVRQDRRVTARIRDLLAGIRQALTRLESLPRVEVRTSDGKQTLVRLGPDDLRRAIFFAMGERESITHLTMRLARIIDGDLTPLAEFALRSRLDNRELVMALSIDCAAGVSAGRRRLVAEQSRSALLGDASVLDLIAACGAWPVADLGDDYRATFSSSVPTLAISGTLDSRTPPEVAEAALASFSNWRHVIIEGGSHDDDLFLSSPRIADVILTFLKGENVRSHRIVLPPLRFGVP